MDMDIDALQYDPHWYMCTNVIYNKISSNKTYEYKLNKLSANKDILFIENNENVIIGPFKLDSSLAGGKYKYVITTDDGKIEGNKFYSDSNGNTEITDIDEKQFYLKIPKDTISDKRILKIKLIGEKSVTKQITNKYNVTATYSTIGTSESNNEPMNEFQRVKVTGQLEKKEKITEKEQPYVEWEMEYGNLEITKQDAENSDSKLQGVKIRVQCNATNYDETFTTDENGKISIDNLYAGTYTITEISNPHYGYNVMAQGSVTLKGGMINKYTLKNVKYTGNLKIEKKDKDIGNYLEGVSFNIKKDGHYVRVKAENEWKNECTGIVHLEDMKFINDQKDATTFTTNESGIIEIRNILTGTYEIKEISTGNHFGYDISEDEEENKKYISWNYISIANESNKGEGTGSTAIVTIDKTGSGNTANSSDNQNVNEIITFLNKKKYIKISGYAWEDIIKGKGSELDNKYTIDVYTDPITGKQFKDERLNNVTVNLIKDGKILASTITHTITNEKGQEERGVYVFGDYLNNPKDTKIKIEDLQGAYIEFSYNGLAYGTVEVNSELDEGNKATDKSAREEYNKNFAEIRHNKSITVDNNNGYSFLYTENDHSSKLDYGSNIFGYENQKYPITTNSRQYMLTANTKDASPDKLLGQRITIDEIYKQGLDEIPNINLGLYERVQPDISLVKDLHSVKLSINGKDNIYNYSQRFKEDFDPTEDDLNVGVKYKNEYTGSYNRAIYKADYIYNDTTNESKNLKVYLTYKIRLINETTGLAVKVNSIVDYYDERYILNDMGAVGRNVNQKEGTIIQTEGITYKKEAYGNGYSKVIIDTNTQIDSQGMSDIYVQFELNRDAVVSILSGRETLDNVAEINSYSVFDTNGNAYAGIDKDSNPGNAIPGNATTYEDDTDSAPSLLLEATESRKMTGTVFLDESTGGVGLVRQGDGIYDEAKEKGIAGVEVKLTETTGTGEEKQATTNENGYFEFTDYIPGDYTLTYTWGDETYTVQNYKGTIYNYKERANNKEWYKATTPRYSDAIDDYELRINFDNELTTTTNKMNSTTPIMGIGVENVDTSTAAIGNKYEFLISNIDFGIVERARQELGINKKIKSIKITLANGQTIVDGEVIEGEDGTLKLNYNQNIISGMGASESSYPRNGYLKAEIDSELLQGSTLKIQYVISLTNNSELDYDSEQYYLYGEKGENDKPIIYIPSGIYDYLDNNLASAEDKDSKWETKTISEYNSSVSEPTIIENYLHRYSLESTDSQENIIEYTGYESFKEQYQVENWNMETIKEARKKRLADKTILYNGDIEDIAKSVIPGNSIELATLDVSKVLSNSDEINLNNNVEITKVTRTTNTGRRITVKSLYDSAETLIITPNTGENKDYIPIVTMAITFLITLGTGIVFIKKKILR